MQQCGFCSLLSSLLRHSMCVGSRRGSSDSCYKEIGEEETTRKCKTVHARSRFTTSWFKRRRGKVSIRSSDTEEIFQEIVPMRRTYDTPRRYYERMRRFMEDMKEMDNVEEKNIARFLTLNKKRRKRSQSRTLYETGLIDDILNKQAELLLRHSASWQFNAFNLNNMSGGRCLPALCEYLFRAYDLISYFNLDTTKLTKLFLIIEDGYHSNNPYHNSIHAADVTQAMHCFLQQPEIRKHLGPIEIMAALLAAITHDLDHPGVNQTFLIATSNLIADLYKNKSVLENHHWRVAMCCLKQSGVFDGMPDLYNDLRTQISSLILATDITRQENYLRIFKKHLDMNTLDLSKKENRHLVLQMALKCADISNPCRSWHVSYKWSLKVCEEFFRQGDYERERNIPPTSFCNRHKDSIPDIQTGFFSFIVKPLITEWHRFLQNELSIKMFDNLFYNHYNWKMLKLEAELLNTETVISEVNVPEDVTEASRTDMSTSSELLLPPPPNSSLTPGDQSSLKEHLRRFSAPLSMFQDSKFWNKGIRRASSGADSHQGTSQGGSGQSLKSHLSAGFQYTKEMSQKFRTSLTTPSSPTRFIAALKEKRFWKLQRQDTFPPPSRTARVPVSPARHLHTSDQGAAFHTGIEKSFDKYSNITQIQKDELVPNFKQKENTELLKTSDLMMGESSGSTQIIKKESETVSKDTDNTKDDQQTDPESLERELKENLAAAQRDGSSSINLRPRRESLPTDILSFSQNVKDMREGTPAIPQLLCRTVSGKEYQTHRRGSAPASVAQSDIRVLSSLGPIKHAGVGGPRKPTSVPSWQRSFARAPYGVQEGSILSLPRRSSLPVEVITGISSR